MATQTRKPAAVRRLEIAKAVIRIIGTRGLPALTAASLAAEVGVTSGALFRHFASQEEILSHAARHAVSIIASTFPDESLPPRDRLLALARNRVRVLGADPGLAWFLRSEQAVLALPEEVAELLRGLVQRSRAWVLAALREGVAGGSLRGDLSPEVLQVVFLGTVHALLGGSGLHGASEPPLQRAEEVLEGLMRLLAPPAAPDTAAGTDRSVAPGTGHELMEKKRKETAT